MSRAIYDHEHTYVGVGISNKMYRCTKEGCPHTIPASLLVGRKAKCHTCEETFVVTTEHLKRKFINHIGCGQMHGSLKVGKREAPAPVDNEPVNVAALFERMRGNKT